MKVIFKIAKAELRKLFFSPVAWSLAVIFMVLGGFYFFDLLVKLTTYQDSEFRINPIFESLPSSMTIKLFRLSNHGFMGIIQSNLYLFVPLLTMGLINHEFNTGTSKLLFSSPIKAYQIVWGKYLSIVVYNLVFFLFMGLIVLIGFFSIKDFDWGVALSPFLSLYMLMCTYCAIGMFMSSISNYPIVSAVFTFIVLFLLNQIGTFWQEIDFIRHITYQLSINDRAQRMGASVVTTRDFIYFVSIAGMFIYFTYLQLKHGRESVSKLKKSGRFLLAFFIVNAVVFLSSRPGFIGYWDPTRETIYTIKPITQSIIEGLDDGELEVTMYTNLLNGSFRAARPSTRNNYIYYVWEKYFRFKPDIKFNYVDYYDIPDGDSSLYKTYPNITLDSIAHEYAIRSKAIFSNYLKPAEIRSVIDLQEEGMRAVMELKYKGKKIFLRTYDDGIFWPEEAHFAAAFKRLSTDSIPKIYVSTGHYERSIYKKGERDISGYSMNKLSRDALINNGFEFDTINLNYKEVPVDAHSLLVADPKVVLNDTVLKHLSNYIEKGGNLLVLGEVEKQHIVNPITQQFGVTLMPGSLVSVSRNETPDKIFGNAALEMFYKFYESERVRTFIKKEYSHGHIPKRLFPGATHLQYTDKGYNHTSAWATRPKDKVWSKANKLISDSASPIMNSGEGDYLLDSFEIAKVLDRNVGAKNQRIGVVGDADFLSNLRPFSHDIGRDLAYWMSNSAYPIHILPTVYQDDKFLITSKIAKTLKTIFAWILPALVGIIGSILLIRRRRQ